MRTETKIGLGLFVVSTTLKCLLSSPDFISGLLIGLSLTFLVIGFLPESLYRKVKTNQTQKLAYLKKVLGTSR